MDTPDNKQITVASLSRFEDSPVFNYINNLSPLEQIKSVHSDHSLNLVTFASPSSFFASPKISSLRESRVLFRSNLSPHGNKGTASKGNLEALQLSSHSTEQLENLSPGSSNGEVTADPLDEALRLAIETPKCMKYDGGTSVSNKLSSTVKGTSRGPLMAGESSLLLHPEENDLTETNHFEDKSNLRQICRIERSKETADCDWVSLVSDDVLNSNLSVVESDSEEPEQETVDTGAISFVSTVIQLPQENANDLSTPNCSCKQNEMTEPVTQPEERRDLKDMDQSPDVLSTTLLNKLVVSDPRTKVDNKEEECDQSGCKQHNIRRRCLVFEMTGSHKKQAASGSSTMPSVPSQADCKDMGAEKHVRSKTEKSCSSSLLAGVGLHLNALATNSKNGKVVKCETLASGRKVITMRGSVSSSLSLASCQNLLKKPSTLSSKERDSVPCANEVTTVENAIQASVNVSYEELENSSPKRKRYKPEHNDESKVCKRCNCKRSKCLKLYCECFAAGLYCIEPCSCLDCFNKPIYEDKVLETRRQIEFRNPLAFAPKVIRSIDSIAEFGDETNKTPASARHKKGCNCRRSSCLKKYCECFQSGVGCSISCRCEGCKNSFGRKDGAEETEYEGYESENCKKDEADTNFKDNTVKGGEDEHSELLIPSSDIPRAKRSGSSLLLVGQSPRLCTSLKASNFFNQPKFEKHLQLTQEHLTPKILKSSLSKTSDATPASPNSKRDSSPCHEIGSSTSRFAIRRLTLRSSLSFPSVTPPRDQ